MRVLLLGVGGFHPSETSHTACLFLPELGVVLDAGTAAFRVARHVVTDRIDVYLTHAHLDHVIGLTYLLGLERDGRPVERVVHARPETLAAVRQHLLAEALFPVAPVDRFQELSDPSPLVAGGTLRSFPLDHPGGAVGYRLEAGGKSLAYVSDTRRLSAEGVEAIRGVDLLIHEAHFSHAESEMAQLTGHSTTTDAAWAAEQAGAGRLVLVHRNPRAEGPPLAVLGEAREIFPDAEFATDGQAIDV